METSALLDLDFIKESNPVKQCLAIKTNKEKCNSSIIENSQYCKRHHNLISKTKSKKQRITPSTESTSQNTGNLSSKAISTCAKADLNCINTTIPELDVLNTPIATTDRNIIKVNKIKKELKATTTAAKAETTAEKKDETAAKAETAVVEGYVMDEKVNISNLVVKKKRGRRRKIDISDNFYNNEYITVWSEIIDGKKLLIDNDNNVYTFNLSSPEYLGKKTLACKIVKP
jgi:hypothetical protein